jgi:hypothetical protein
MSKLIDDGGAGLQDAPGEADRGMLARIQRLPGRFTHEPLWHWRRFTHHTLHTLRNGEQQTSKYRQIKHMAFPRLCAFLRELSLLPPKPDCRLKDRCAEGVTRDYMVSIGQPCISRETGKA